VAQGSRPGDKNTWWNIRNVSLIKRLFAKPENALMKTSLCCSRPATLPGEMVLTQQVATNYQAFLKAVDTISSLDSPENQRQVYEREVVPSGQI